MDRYQKVERPKEETPIDENEIRITSQGRMRSYISYAMTLLQEKGSDEIVFKAMGRAINKAITIVELIKRTIVGLHQITSVQSMNITDTWEPLEEGLQTYQPPIPADLVKVPAELDGDGGGGLPLARGRGVGRGRGRGRGRPRAPLGNGFTSAEYEDGGYQRNRGYSVGRGKGRGRGRYFGGRGRGGHDRGHGTRGRGRGFGSNESPTDTA